MYSSSRDQRDPWPPSSSSVGVSRPANNPKSTYSPSHVVSFTTPLNDPARHARFVYTSGGSPSAHHQSLPSQRHPASLGRRLSKPNTRSVVARSGHSRPLLNGTEACSQRLQQHRQSFQHSVTSVMPSPSSASPSADRRPSTFGSVVSFGCEPRGDIRAEPSQEVKAVVSTPTHGVYASIGSSSILIILASFLLDLSPIMAGNQNVSPVERYYSALFNPLCEHNIAAQSRSSSVVGVDPLLYSETSRNNHPSAPSLVPIARPVASEEEQDDVLPGPSVSKTDSFVSLPRNATRKRLYRCSWSDCTKSFGTLNHLNVHIVMQRHGSKRTPAGEIHTNLRD